MNKQLLEMTKCRWREFRREPSAIFWVIFMPLFWMMTLGFALSDKTDVRFNVGWVETGEMNEQYKTALKNDSRIELISGTDAQIAELNKQDRLLIIVEMSGSSTHIAFDEHNSKSATAAAYVENVLQKTAGRQDPMPVIYQAQLNTQRRYVDFLIPGLLGLSILTTSLFGTAMTLVSNRRENLLKRYLATPMRPIWFFGSHVLNRFLTLGVESGAILITGWLIFRFNFWSHFFSLAVFSILGAAAFTALAILLASRIRDVASMSSIVKMITLPAMMLSGVFFPLSSFPFWLQPLLKYLPLTALIDGLRRITTEGATLWTVHTECLVLLISFVIGVVGSLKFFRWE